MDFTENIRLAFHGIWGHKMRSCLTMLGIIIGISSIIAIVSMMRGTNEQIKQNVIGAGSNTVNVQLTQGDWALDLSYAQRPSGVPVITKAVRDEILAIKEVEAAALYTRRSAYDNIFYGSTALSGGWLYGSDRDFFDVHSYKVVSGRGFVDEDFSLNRKVALLDVSSADSLFSDDTPVGKTIEIMGEPFTVIGVVDHRRSFEPVINSVEEYYTYKSQTSGFVFISSAVWPVLFGYDEPQNLVLRATATEDMAIAGKRACDILNARMTVSSTSNIRYKGEDTLERAKQLQELAAAAQRQLLWIASISLLVGGIGVMNIMLVSVTERTKEIGLKKALGAPSRVILIQFLTEASVLTCIGGILGVIGGVGLAFVVSAASSTPAAISIPAIIIAVLFSVLIGVVFGLLPAIKAANQNPIDALRRS